MKDSTQKNSVRGVPVEHIRGVPVEHTNHTRTFFTCTKHKKVLTPQTLEAEQMFADREGGLSWVNMRALQVFPFYISRRRLLIKGWTTGLERVFPSTPVFDLCPDDRQLLFANLESIDLKGTLWKMCDHGSRVFLQIYRHEVCSKWSKKATKKCQTMGVKMGSATLFNPALPLKLLW